MTDTPEHVKKLQLQIWLSKPPGERLRQFLVDNGDLYSFWKSMKEQVEENKTIPKPKKEIQ
jgi:hypothetical protein